MKRDRYTCERYERDGSCGHTRSETKSSAQPCETCVIEELRRAADADEAERRHMKRENDRRGGGQGRDKRRWI